jgi:hypothetical protein
VRSGDLDLRQKRHKGHTRPSSTGMILERSPIDRNRMGSRYPSVAKPQVLDDRKERLTSSSSTKLNISDRKSMRTYSSAMSRAPIYRGQYQNKPAGKSTLAIITRNLISHIYHQASADRTSRHTRNQPLFRLYQPPFPL